MNAKNEKLDTRTQLLQAGMKLFLTQGFHGTGIKAILDVVGVPKGSFYNYFESKNAFGVATIEYYADRVAERLTRSKANASDPIEALRAFFGEEMAQFESEDFVGGCLVANLGGELEGSDPLREALDAAMGRYLGGISTTIREAQNAGLVRQDIEAEELARFFVDTWEGAVIRMKISRDLSPLRDCLKHHLEGYMRPE